MKLVRNFKWCHGRGILPQIRVAVVILTLTLHFVTGIRVYDDTNFPDVVDKPQKISSFLKKPVYLTKRSWSPPVDNLKSGTKLNRRSNGKWKDLSKAQENEVPILYKIKFNEKKVLQYLKYIKEIPRLKEFTFCLWYKPSNLSHDHTLFSYSLNKNENLLKFWINAFDSTLRLAIKDVVVYKVPANIRELKWHHICQSWDGVPGEWQVFLDGKRIGAGVLSHYKETYIPEGGEIVVGQELLDVEKGLNNNLEGEVFGFNLVDQAVSGEQGNFINSQYKPSIGASVPPFKKLPPIKKTYQEIKAYISKLPPAPNELRRLESKQFSGDNHNINQRTKNRNSTKRNRENYRAHHPHLRKVVIYNRDDRQLLLDEADIKINTTKQGAVSSRQRTLTEPKKNNLEEQERKMKSHPFDENYSIHSYRTGKDEKRNSKYEIYEALEEDVAKPLENDKLTEQQSMESKAKGNFNLFTAREANKVYTMSNSVKDFKKPKFHFETTSLEDNIRRSIVAEESRSEGIRKPVKTERKLMDSIPVYETELALERQRRQTSSEQRESRELIPDDILKIENGFRRLPEIPDSFINAFTKNASKTELEQTLNQYFKTQNATNENSNVAALITESPKTYFSESTELSLLPENSKLQTAPPRTTEKNNKSSSQLPVTLLPASRRQQTDSRILTERNPIKFPIIQDFDPALRLQSDNYMNWYEKSEAVASRRKFDVSAGTDLIIRAYGLCTVNRGSPVEDKNRLVISWADTPIRIFGGAEVEHAKNKCGNF